MASLFDRECGGKGGERCTGVKEGTGSNERIGGCIVGVRTLDEGKSKKECRDGPQ